MRAVYKDKEIELRTEVNNGEELEKKKQKWTHKRTYIKTNERYPVEFKVEINEIRPLFHFFG